MKIANTSFRFMLSLLLVLSALFMSCEPNNNSDPFIPGENNEIGLDLGSSIQRDFMGRIVDEANLPIENAVVTIGTKVASTDANGMFIINNADVKQKQAFIIAKKPGFLKGMRSVVPTQGTNQIEIMLVTENLAGTVASGNSSNVTLTNGTKVSFDGNFKDENGNAYSGNVAVYIYHLDPANPNVEALMPGNLQAENANGEARVLETYGMINVELKGDAGQQLNIADGSVAEIELPLDPAQTGVAPSIIPLWHFDEVNGYWVEDGEAILVGGKYVGEVSHFSWWNCDAQFPTVTLCLNLVDNATSPVSNVKVELWRSGATYPRVGRSNGNGEICGLIPANETLTLNAFNQCGDIEYTTTIGPFSINTNLGNIVLTSVVSTTVTGNLVDCSNVNVTNGYVVLDYGNELATVQVVNGAFTFSLLQCPALLDFTLEGIDYDTFQTTNDVTFNFTNSNVGNIIACNAISEYISVQVDSNPIDYYITDIDANDNQQGVGFTISAPLNSGTGTEWFYVGLGSITPGNYTLAQFGLEATSIAMDYAVPNNLQLNLASYGSVGNYIDATINGTFTDLSGVIRTLSVTIHVLRDS
ncbi:hypothetical protein [Lacinutrix sp. Hel_I_90]|uniref:hypothetical protein n=1 Tax=Lacinutrix sp. Hel_I_90 TaxID=1249999 RepID=UPI0005C96324|nr:hypothetical protein [Lacinutrix sp. Hel_I_90]